LFAWPTTEKEKSEMNTPMSEQDRAEPVKDIFPRAFLSFMSARLQGTLERLMVVYGLPEPAVKAVDSLAVLEMMVNHNPDTWRPMGREGYETELQALIQSIAWTVAELDDLQSERIQEHYDELQRSNNPALQVEFGWRD
jgi:hypothetical protein